ncbi:MAG: FapA family protein [Spirochaetaceae bacterium]|jgi:uncharacterized protein (DUF342 family)|nr:FapA family protein [Spirochaetaceae bacterium]
MVDFVQLQQLMKAQLDSDRAVKIVDVDGPNLDAAVAEAAVMLNMPVGRIEYEVVERGFPGFLGTGKKDWKIKAYGKLVNKKIADLEAAAETKTEAVTVEVIKDKDGDVFVQLTDDGAMLKVTAPIGAGKRVTEGEANLLLKTRDITDIDANIVKMAVREAKGLYIRVGGFNRKYSNDVMASVNITDQDMKAFVSLMPPGPGGADMTAEMLTKVLKDNKVMSGLKEEFIIEFTDRPSYKTPVLVAEGSEPANGKNAYIQYAFNAGGKARPKQRSDGRVDFRESNSIQNVVKDQPLGRKIPIEEGKPGKTVTGAYLPAKAGTDLDLNSVLGNNVYIGDDKCTIYAKCAGQFVLAAGKINVEPVYTVQGNVNLKTGNITFLGTVIVTGNVEDGFSVKATSSIEVKGTVEKAEIEAEGDVVILKGISGKGAGSVKAGGSVWAKFIENATIEAGNMVVANDGIINSQVDALKRIVCAGKRARIVGGCYRASEEINAKIIGSAASGTETICEVGVDPKTKKQFDDLIDRKLKTEKELEEAKLNFQTLDNILKQRKSLPEDKEKQMQEIMVQHKELTEELKGINAELDKLKSLMNTVKTRGRVSASEKIFPGVKVIIRDQNEDVKNEYKAITFILENDLIKAVKYEAPDEESTRPPPEIGE